MLVAFHKFLARHFSRAHVEQIEGAAKPPPSEAHTGERHFSLDPASHRFIETPDPHAPEGHDTDPDVR
jgi:hypothetical protein